MTATASRYRDEDGVSCVDVRVGKLDQLFDNRDPAPFRERDLDPELAEYLYDSGEDLLGAERVRVVFWLEQPCVPKEVEEAFRAHFEEARDRAKRDRRRQRGTGFVALFIALPAMAALLALSQFIVLWVPGSGGAMLKEGLILSSWILMWRPAEVLIYDWIPVRHERRVLAKLLAADLAVRTGKGPEPRPKQP